MSNTKFHTGISLFVQAFSMFEEKILLLLLLFDRIMALAKRCDYVITIKMVTIKYKKGACTQIQLYYFAKRTKNERR